MQKYLPPCTLFAYILTLWYKGNQQAPHNKGRDKIDQVYYGLLSTGEIELCSLCDALGLNRELNLFRVPNKRRVEYYHLLSFWQLSLKNNNSITHPRKSCSNQLKSCSGPIETDTTILVSNITASISLQEHDRLG